MRTGHDRTPLVLIALIATVSCSLISGDDYDHFRIRVDSIVAPDTAASGDSLRITLFGFVGPDGCYSFDRIDSRRTTNSVELSVWGRHRTGRGFACTHAVVELRQSHVVPPPLGIPFSVIVVQPDGSRLNRPIDVR